MSTEKANSTGSSIWLRIPLTLLSGLLFAAVGKGLAAVDVSGSDSAVFRLLEYPHNPTATLPEGWSPVSFPNVEKQTDYQLASPDTDPSADSGVAVIQAQAQASASGLIRQIHYDPGAWPVLEWSWKVSGVYPDGDLSRKKGDDYPARIYISFDDAGVELSWWERTQLAAYELFYGERPPLLTLTYIWANRAPVGTLADNPFTGRVKMIVVDSGEKLAGQWTRHRRRLDQDFEKAFGFPAPEVTSIAIMTDADNTGGNATAWYGPVSAHDK